MYRRNPAKLPSAMFQHFFQHFTQVLKLLAGLYRAQILRDRSFFAGLSVNFLDFNILREKIYRESVTKLEFAMFQHFSWTLSQVLRLFEGLYRAQIFA